MTDQQQPTLEMLTRHHVADPSSGRIVGMYALVHLVPMINDVEGVAEIIAPDPGDPLNLRIVGQTATGTLLELFIDHPQAIAEHINDAAGRLGLYGEYNVRSPENPALILEFFSIRLGQSRVPFVDKTEPTPKRGPGSSSSTARGFKSSQHRQT